MDISKRNAVRIVSFTVAGVVLSAAIMAQSVPFVYAAEKSIASSEPKFLS